MWDWLKNNYSPKFMVMKEHVTECNNVAHSCVLKSFQTSTKVYGTEFRWYHHQVCQGVASEHNFSRIILLVGSLVLV